MKKTTQLRNLINSNSLEFIMEAHNGLSAKIVEEAGFKGIWASGLSISASMGVRDNNEASWTQVLEVLEFMSDATSIPILLDGDTGYGNFNNARRLVKKLESRQIAGVCIEDKLFPKTNSFISGEAQPLADIEEFCGKIKAMKESQTDDDFVVVARVEAFIAGWGLREALRRAEAYRQAGADAILIHSKRNDAAEIEAFMKEWGNRLPVVIVPTKYYSVPTQKFRELGVSLVIWANHNLRAAIKAMQETSRQIRQEQSLVNIEPNVVSVNEVFRLQGVDELKQAEKRYLPASGKNVNAIILAASRGDMDELTAEIPKTLLEVGGKSLLATQIDEFNKVGIKDICVVRGFAKDKVAAANFSVIDNDLFAETKELYSLYLAKDKIKENTVISYGDIIFKNYILNDLLNDMNDITLIVDADVETISHDKDLVSTDTPYSKKLYSSTVRFIKMSGDLKEEEIHGEFIGLWKVTKNGSKIVKKALEELSKREDFKQLTMADLFNYISSFHPIAVKYIKGSWLDIDTIRDLQKAGDLFDKH
ncbi:phosphoenolpyruvate mutase [Geobacillus sp. NFOSA3]|uniref:phosphoenolpyruvate mutase n=1 Tax=Parageobacillus toebii NBRC 107807 TaxID=1223503 RepID=A0A6G9J3X0_9BACL|nr:phosphoenolpyruvate mutase [Parageobacillus toebii]MBB3868928.1 phosphoenolpyruvate phosphomutase [Parageobacillus toebii NBRC 107807]NNU94446.1 phosphoenolpyruvate mutase [Geobacillus sp. NFOSA3]QIQ33356.1 phosphoenolpyruvate mutase [Parageobacillus toebii NBRC 107807]